jgi:hypothetical protein
MLPFDLEGIVMDATVVVFAADPDERTLIANRNKRISRCVAVISQAINLTTFDG